MDDEKNDNVICLPFVSKEKIKFPDNVKIMEPFNKAEININVQPLKNASDKIEALLINVGNLRIMLDINDCI